MTDYSWEIETLADCADGLDAANLRELIGELKGDRLYIMDRVIEKMEVELAQKIDHYNLCPNCLTELQVKMKVHVSNNWDEPGGSWEEVDGEGCPECGWEG